MDTGTLADIPISVWNFNSVHDLELCSSAPHFPNLLTVRESPALLLPDTPRPHLNHSALASRSLSLAPCTLQCSQVLLFTRSTAVSPLAQALLLKHMHFTSSSQKHNSISWWHSSNQSWSPPPRTLGTPKVVSAYARFKSVKLSFKSRHLTPWSFLVSRCSCLCLFLRRSFCAFSFHLPVPEMSLHVVKHVIQYEHCIKPDSERGTLCKYVLTCL